MFAPSFFAPVFFAAVYFAQGSSGSGVRLVVKEATVLSLASARTHASLVGSHDAFSLVPELEAKEII